MYHISYNNIHLNYSQPFTIIAALVKPISNIFKDVEDSNEFSTTIKENFEKNDSKVDNTAGGQELKNKDIDFTENVDEDLEKLPPPSKKLNKIDDDDEEMNSTENPTKYYSALDSTVS